ncbi:MAG: hypothetical protein JXA03_15630 [Bacteroidales bacterium]|nr:hypothetical protein [Bacteroidales bacterium]
MEKAILRELELHPKATLVDLYKNFFQGRFGPGHMISNREAALNYLLSELEEAENFDTVKWQAVGYEGRYFRINLSLVRDSIISPDQLTDAFTGSANTAEQPTHEAWMSEWNYILSVIESLDLSLPTYLQDLAAIDKNLKNGILVGHHSDIYKNTYYPHYRIVTEEYFDKLITP